MQEGDYVYIQYNNYKAYAFIVDMSDNQCQVAKVYREMPDGRINHYHNCPTNWIYKSELNPTEDIVYPEDVQALINLSLDSWDKDWFEELMGG
jgi:hypothetical protein